MGSSSTTGTGTKRRRRGRGESAYFRKTVEYDFEMGTKVEIAEAAGNTQV